MNEKEAYRVLQKASGIKVGDKVRVLRTYGRDEMGCCAGQITKDWLRKFGKHIGTVVCIHEEHIVVEQDGVNFHHPFFVLEVIESAKPEKMIDVDGKEYSLSTVKKALKEYSK